MILRDPGLFQPDLPLSRRELAPLLDAALVAMGLSGARYELRLTDDAGIEALNRSFLSTPGPTNVLSFPAGPAAGKGKRGAAVFLGEMAVSVDTAVREAFLYGQDPVEHFLRLLCHGLSHLAGLDHGEAMDALSDAALDAALAAAYDAAVFSSPSSAC